MDKSVLQFNKCEREGDEIMAKEWSPIDAEGTLLLGFII